MHGIPAELSCLNSLKSERREVERKDVEGYPSVITERGVNMRIQIEICLQVILLLGFKHLLHDVAAGTQPTSDSDANLMFELLLGGVELDQDNNIVLLDKEIASMRAGRAFLSQINDNVPRSPSSMKQMVTTLDGQRGRRRPLTQDQFESLVLSMVYSAHRIWNQERGEEQEAWGGVLLQLANVTVHELRGSYLFSYE